MTPCSLADKYRRFREICCMHLSFGYKTTALIWSRKDKNLSQGLYNVPADSQTSKRFYQTTRWTTPEQVFNFSPFPQVLWGFKDLYRSVPENSVRDSKYTGSSKSQSACLIMHTKSLTAVGQTSSGHCVGQTSSGHSVGQISSGHSVGQTSSGH